MKASSVKSKFVLKCMRFDGKFHLSEGLEVRKIIAKCPYGTDIIENVTTNIYCPGIFSRNYTKTGTPFLGGGDILKANYDSGKYLREKTTPNHKTLAVKRGSTLVTCGGTIGCAAFVNSSLSKCWASQHVMRVEPKGIKEGLLYSYLASKHGYLLLTTNTYGSVIPTLNSENIASLPIPNFPQEFQANVDNLIQESAQLREEATDTLYEAISLVENEIGSSRINLGYNYGSVSSSCLTSQFQRFDSQYQLGMKQLSKIKRNLKTSKLGSFATDIFVGNRGKRIYVKKGIPFISSSDMMLANPLRDCKQISKNTPGLSQMIVNKGDILISRSGTVGNTIIVGDYLSGTAVSEHAMKLVIDKSKIAPEYVYAYLLTGQGQDSLKTLPYGSVIVTLGEMFLADLDLPLIDGAIYEEVVKLIKNYITKSDESVRMENEAIAMVEQEIEKWNK